ncbi:unnamed protein product [Chrysoparadoxa australica]
MVLACDGVWDVIGSQECVNFVTRRLSMHRDVQRASRELIHKALQHASRDNCSCIIICLNQVPSQSPCSGVVDN